MNKPELRQRVVEYFFEITKEWNGEIYKLGGHGKFNQRSGYLAAKTQVQKAEPLMHSG